MASKKELQTQIADAAERRDELLKQIAEAESEKKAKALNMFANTPDRGLGTARVIRGAVRVCHVCGRRMHPHEAKHYIARDDTSGGLAQALAHTEPKLYDAYDCPHCGAQYIVGERKREYVVAENDGTEVEISEEISEDISEEEYDREERIIREQVVAADLEAVADLKDDWCDEIMAVGKTHGRRVSEQYVRGLLDAAYAYTRIRSASMDGFCRKWCEYLSDPAHDVDTAYAAARLRTRNAGHNKRREGEGA